MTFGQLLKLARFALGDTEASQDKNQLLPEAIGLMYFNEAIHEACRRARLIVDRSTAAVCSYVVEPDTPIITLDSRIIKIRRVYLASRSQPLNRKFVADMDDMHAGWETHTGSTDSYVADYETGASKKIFLYRRPAVADSLNLVVVRLPLADLAGSDDVPEIPQQYHAALVHYVVAKLRNIEDTELYDLKKALKAEAEFEREFGPKRAAIDEVWEDSQDFEEYE